MKLFINATYMKLRFLYLFLTLSFAANAQERPNVLFIIVDQHSGLITSQAGYPHLTTPGLDKIANEGVYFSRSYCSYPVCTSARKTFLTGEMPSKAGDVTTLTSIGTKFKNEDYETVFYGKWHVGSTHMDDEGVDVWHGFDTYIDDRDDSDIYGWSSAFLKQEHEKPFFMITSFLNPHDCCELARNIAGDNDSYHDGPVEENADTAICPQLPYNFAIPPNEAEGYYTRRDQDPEDNYWSSMPNKLWTEVEWRQYMYGYDRLVEKVDKHVENLYDDLVAEGLIDNTIIVYTSDHGDGHGSHAWTQKKSFYEESVNVPLVISWKGKTHQGLIDKETLASGLDIYPTILELAGISYSADLPGKDLSPVLFSDEVNPTIDRDYVVSEINQKAYKGNTPGTFVGRMVVNQDYKYVLFDKGVNREQLFDIKNDPGELVPVVDDAAYETILAECRLQLKDWVSERNDDFDVDAIISEYEATALLDAVLLNGEKIADFNPLLEEQVLFVDVDELSSLDAVPVNSAAALSIQEPTDLQGDEAERTMTITVSSEDALVTKTYTIRLDEKPNRLETGFIDTGADEPFDGWTSNYVLISEKILGPENHGLYEGDGALKFVRGQSDKKGHLTSTFYEELDSISFWMYVYEPSAEEASLKIETNTETNGKVELGTIMGSDLLDDAWTEFGFSIDPEEATQLIFTPSLPYDGDTRLWMDDLTLFFKEAEEVEEIETGFNMQYYSSLNVYPNPCASTITIDAVEGGKLNIYDITGEVMFSKAKVASKDVLDISSLDRGIYIVELEGTKAYTQRIIKN